MATTFSVANWRNVVLNALTGVVQNNYKLVANGLVRVYTGSQPANPDTAATGTLLVTFTLLTNALSSANAGSSALAAYVQATAVATGTAGYARWIDASGSNAVIDGSVGVAASGAAFILDTLSIGINNNHQLRDCGLKLAAGAGTLKLNFDLRNKLLDIWTQATGVLNMGKAGTLSIYTGSQPASADAPATGTKLVDIPMGTSGTCCYATAGGGAAALTGNQVANAIASGTAGWARWTKDLYTIDGSVGTSGADFILDSLSLTSGNAATLTEATISL